MARSYSAVPLPCDPSPSPRSHGPVRAAHNEAAKNRRTFAFARQVAAAGATIADHVTINLDATLGENVAIAPQVVIYTGSHRVGPGSMRIGAVHASPVTIEDGAWVRLGAVLAPGVTIGRGSIVAAGAVVLKDVPANTYVEGNLAAVVRRLPWGDR